VEYVEKSADVAIRDQKVIRPTNAILKIIEKTCAKFSNSITKGLVMQKVMANPIVKTIIPTLLT
jgi:hypothetical protein